MSQPFVYRDGLVVALLAGAQTLLAPLVSVASLFACYRVYSNPIDAEFVVLAAMVVLLSVMMLQPSRLMASQISLARLSVALSILSRWGVLLGLLFAIGYATKQSTVYSRQVVLTWAVVTPSVLIGGALFLQEVMRRFATDTENARRAVIAGCNEVSIALSQRLRQNPLSGVRFLGFFDDRSPDRLGSASGIELLGKLPELGEFVKRERIDMIFIALPVRHVQRVLDLLDDLRDTTASIYYVPDIFVFDLIQARTGDFYGIPVVAMCETPFYGYRGAVKRLLDITISATALVVLLPIMLIAALAVKLSSPGPAIFRQRRYGLDGQEITVYKFRSMTVTEDGDRIEQARREDPRFTAVGSFLRRTSLDELPQLINVLQGRMSLVGPRPHAVAHNEEYRRLIKGYMVRHKVLPGMTGLAQVNGCRGEISGIHDMEKRLEYDLEYLRRWTPVLDVYIIMLTVLRLFGDKRAY
ncbi:MAG: undecaprenyl-phosphate glucose phosphotransferase [Pseudomonadota bacterium]